MHGERAVIRVSSFLIPEYANSISNSVNGCVDAITSTVDILSIIQGAIVL